MKLAEPIYEAQINRLAEVLETPSIVHSSKNHDGYVCLSGEKANWHLCARVAHTALRHHAKATSLVFQIGRSVIHAHRWHERETPVSRPESLSRRDGAVWIDGIDRRPRQFHQQCIGAYCLSMMILLGYCKLEFSNHKDYECYVVLLHGDGPLRKRISTYTQFRPFEPWWQFTDEHRHELVKTDLGTNWTPAGWHFTGQAPSPKEQRLWHPFQERRQRVDSTPSTSIINTKPIVYRAQTDPPEWVRAVRKHEAVPYRINKEMLALLEKLQASGRLNPSQIPAKQTKKAIKEAEEQCKLTETFLDEARRLAGYEKFYQRMHLDFRGRMYTSRSPINYQDDQEYRCLIEFAEGVELDDIGYNSLCFHAANLFELPNDLLPTGPQNIFFRKVKAGLFLREAFLYYAENPLETFDDWQVNEFTDQPLQDPLLFIRACMELRDATTKKRMLRKKGFVTHLPIEVDQTNSAIQHLTLFYGDMDVAEMCSLIAESDMYTEIATGWDVPNLNDHQKRTLVKKIVVPRCYGAGPARIAEEELSNLSFLSNDVDANKRLARQGIYRVERRVPPVRTYRREIASIIQERGLTDDTELTWATMSGFEVHYRPVYVDGLQFVVPISKEERHKRVQLKARYVSHRLSKVDVKKGLQANLVHSVDATLAHMLIAEAEYPVIAVHDAFAAHANNINDLRIDFASHLIGVHLMGKPLQNFRADILGEPRPGLDWNEASAKTIAILREIENRGFLEMIS